MNRKDRTGEQITTPNGDVIHILEYFSCLNCTIKFPNGAIKYNVNFNDAKNGHVKNITERIGEIWTNNKNEKATIIGYRSAIDCDIQFEDGSIVEGVRYTNVIRKSFRNPNSPIIYGVGFQGIGIYTFVDNLKIRNVWVRMIQRCYDRKYQEKQPTYKEVSVCEEWYNFQNFAEWFEENWKPWMDENWQLDKDIICKDCKVYSPETCCFVPREINGLFTLRTNKRGDLPIGVKKARNKFQASIIMYNNRKYLGNFNTPEEAFQAYKTAKEQHIKEVADKWREQISDKVYEALINYQIKITD